MQRLQMCVQDGQNVFVAAVSGNFDDCQRAVKKLFADEDFNKALQEKGVRVSSANSINFGRLAPPTYQPCCLQGVLLPYALRLNLTTKR